MGNFNRDSRPAPSRDFGNRSFGNRGQSSQGGGGRGFSRPGLDRPQMFHATCANCGNDCEVPFRPTGSKPIFCNNCFDRNAGQEGERRSFSGRDERVRTSFSDRPMYDAICTNCGNSCKIPFEPKEGREILCSSCFEAKNGASPRQSSRMGDRPPRHEGGGSNNAQIEALNAKLDKIMAHLGITTASAPTVKLKEVKSEKVEAPVVVSAKKTARDAKVMDAEEPQEQVESVSEILEEVLAEGLGESAVLPDSEKVRVVKKASPKKKTSKKKDS